jgi:hypothetical protein
MVTTKRRWCHLTPPPRCTLRTSYFFFAFARDREDFFARRLGLVLALDFRAAMPAATAAAPAATAAPAAAATFAARLARGLFAVFAIDCFADATFLSVAFFAAVTFFPAAFFAAVTRLPAAFVVAFAWRWTCFPVRLAARFVRFAAFETARLARFTPRRTAFLVAGFLAFVAIVFAPIRSYSKIASSR